MKTRIFIINLSALLILLMPVFSLAQSEWMVSEKKQKESNPIAFSDKSVKDGKIVFLANCKSCHGDPGKANGLPLVPAPTDIALQSFLDKNTDGSIFNKMTDGQITMPSYKAILSDDQRWNLVNFIRSFDANHVIEKPTPKKQTTVTIIEVEDMKIGQPYYMDLKVDSATSEVTVSFFGTADNEKVAMPDVEIFIGIKRYFGNLAIMEAGATTDEQGILQTIYPSDMLSGEDGLAELIVYPVDKDVYGEITKTATLQIESCQPSHFSETRALWANRANFPIWLLVTYLSMVIIAWGVMGKVVMNIFKIKKIGN